MRPTHTMNTAPLKRTLSVTGLLLTGAGCGVIAIKVVAPQFLSPTAANALTLPSGGEGGGGSMAAVPRANVRARATASIRPGATAASPVPFMPTTRSAAAEPAFSLPAVRPPSKSL